MKKIFKISIGTFIGASTVTAVAVPLVLKTVYQRIEEKTIAVNFNGQTFSNRSSLLKYINKNSSKLKMTPNANLYSLSLGNDSLQFDTYKKALDFIKNRIESKEVYLKPGVNKKNDLASIGADSFVEVVGTRKYVVFEKYSKRFDKTDIVVNGKLEHSYTTALLPVASDSQSVKDKLERKIEEARLEAAKSYIKVHTSYFFNGIYFKTLNDLRTYLITNKGDNFSQIVTKSDLAIIDTYKGTLKFNKKVNLNNDLNFQSKVKNLSVPFYNATDNQSPKWIAINQKNRGLLAQSIDEKTLDYIRVTSNSDEVTEVVDMDASTPNGTLFGNYYVKSGGSVKSIVKHENWKRMQNTKLENFKELNDISILKSIVNYSLSSKGIGNLVELMNVTTLNKNNSRTFVDFLKDKNYLSKTIELIKGMSRGVRHNLLDIIISTHSFLISNMIKDKLDAKDIITTSKYFDAMAKTMDSFLFPLIAPFISSKTLPKNFEFKYLSSAFSFYDKDKNGGGINFQNNPYSYYRKLIGGLKDDKDSSTRQAYFLMLKASMGLNAIMLNGLRHNQIVFSNWENNTIQRIENSNHVSDLKFSNSKSNYQLWNFKLLGVNRSGDSSKEKISIWNNLYHVPGNVKILDNLFISQTEIIKNYNNYILKYQNEIINDYENKIENKISRIKNKYNNRNQGNSYDAQDFNTNLFSFIALSSSDLNFLTSGNNIATTYDSYKHLNNMVANAVTPLKDRIKDFAVNVGTFAVESVAAVATAGASAETMLAKEAISTKAMGKSNWAKKGRKANFKNKVNYIRSDSEIKGKLGSDLKDAFTKETSHFSTDSPATSILKGVFLGSTGLFVFNAIPEAKEFIDDVLDVTISIARNIIPLLSPLMNIIDKFHSTEKQIYGFKATEDSTKFYWNGGRVDYSWWGLKSNQKYSINDLKMITFKIIPGFKDSEEGFYYKNAIYPSLDALKLAKADEIIRNVLNNSLENINNPKIGWALPFGGQTPNDATKYTSMNDLINAISKYANSSAVSKDIFITTNGLQATADVAYKKAVESIIKTQKKVLIIKMPEHGSDGKWKTSKKFLLPTPYFSNGTIHKAKKNSLTQIENNKGYIVFDPNFKIDEKPEKDMILKLNPNVNIQDPNSKEYKKYKKILQSLMNLSTASDFSGEKSLDIFINKYAQNIYVPSKEVIFDVINGQNNLAVSDAVDTAATKGTYEYLDNSWTKTPETIYQVQEKSGQIKYFLSKRQAIVNLRDKEYKLQSVNLGRETMKYSFNGILFDSIDEIYNYILNNQGGKNEKK